jgi:hypothetical protein
MESTTAGTGGSIAAPVASGPVERPRPITHTAANPAQPLATAPSTRGRLDRFWGTTRAWREGLSDIAQSSAV